ncbi:hypothetical protein EVAR_14072_1 [Eumeta japonica]|uniref:Uncharacterized protein n=1 Tax=Eumeta variegata TaxID=151549 RepID=A0A4C1UN63_EUMVA|nr:hypothetical protein EVAR_14072_1 [Eumeta japonica]
MHSAAGGGAPGCGVVVDKSGGGARLSHARVSEPVSSSSHSGPRQCGLSDRRGGPPKHRFIIRVIVPTMSGQAPRRLLHGRRVARWTLRRPVSAEGGRTSAFCTSEVAAVPSRLHFSRLKCGDIGFSAMIAQSAANSACSAAHTHTGRPAFAPVGVGRDLDGILAGGCSHSRRTWISGELASDPAAPRRGVRRGPLPGVNCIGVRSWVFHTLVLKGAGAGRRTYFLPQARASSRRGYDPNGSIEMVRTIFFWHYAGAVATSPAGARGPRARAVVAHAQPAGGGGHRLDGWYLTRMGGRRSPSRTRSRPLVVGRWLSTHPTAAARAARVGGPRPTTSSFCPQSRCQSGAYAGPLAGARVTAHAQPQVEGGIRAARIGDPLGIDLTERACRPLIRLSMHPTAAARAVRVSEPHPSSSSLRSSTFDVLLSPIFILQSGAYAGPLAGARVIAHALSGGWEGGTGLRSEG